MDKQRDGPGLELFKGIGEAFMAIKRRGRWHLREMHCDLTFEQVMVLTMLTEQDGLQPKEIAEKTERAKTTATRMIDGLERRSLVLRVPDRNDRRQRLVYLTHEGRQRIAELLTLAPLIVDEAVREIEPDQQWLMLGLLRKLTANLGRDQVSP